MRGPAQFEHRFEPQAGRGAAGPDLGHLTEEQVEPVALEGGGGAGQMVRARPQIVVVAEGDETARRLPHAAIARRRRPLRNVIAKQPETRSQPRDRRFERLKGLRFGSVVDDDDLDVGKGLAGDGFEQAAHGLRPIVGRDDDGDRRRGH